FPNTLPQQPDLPSVASLSLASRSRLLTPKQICARFLGCPLHIVIKTWPEHCVQMLTNWDRSMSRRVHMRRVCLFHNGENCQIPVLLPQCNKMVQPIAPRI